VGFFAGLLALPRRFKRPSQAPIQHSFLPARTFFSIQPLVLLLKLSQNTRRFQPTALPKVNRTVRPNFPMRILSFRLSVFMNAG
jgi:hypothetical protein